MSERRERDEDVEERAWSIEGRVQGVGFRWWTRKTAESLGVAGAVRNRSDGSVEVRARGSTGSLDTFRERLGSGPSSARVEEISQTSSSLPIRDGDFRIVR